MLELDRVGVLDECECWKGGCVGTWKGRNVGTWTGGCVGTWKGGGVGGVVLGGWVSVVGWKGAWIGRGMVEGKHCLKYN